MSAKTPEEVRNEQVIRSLYALAEGNAKDMFTDDGYFYDVAASDCLAVEFRIGHAHLSLCEGKTERMRWSDSATIARHGP